MWWMAGVESVCTQIETHSICHDEISQNEAEAAEREPEPHLKSEKSLRDQFLRQWFLERRITAWCRLPKRCLHKISSHPCLAARRYFRLHRMRCEGGERRKNNTSWWTPVRSAGMSMMRCGMKSERKKIHLILTVKLFTVFGFSRRFLITLKWVFIDEINKARKARHVKC